MGRSLSASLVILLIQPAVFAADLGVLPVGADGKPLNLDFETGTLKDWTAEGDAFTGQPIKGDNVAARRPDMKSEHQGDYWIGTYEKLGDKENARQWYDRATRWMDEHRATNEDLRLFRAEAAQVLGLNNKKD